jgi:hypothetical protein
VAVDEPPPAVLEPKGLGDAQFHGRVRADRSSPCAPRSGLPEGCASAVLIARFCPALNLGTFSPISERSRHVLGLDRVDVGARGA